MTNTELTKNTSCSSKNTSNTLEVAAQLKNYLKSLGLSQSMIARQMNCALPSVNQLLTGKRPMGKQTAAKFQELYGISAAWLLTGDGEMIIDQSKVFHDNNGNSITLQVATQLKDYLKSLGLSQTMIANQMNCAQSYVNQLLTGKNPIGKKTAAKFQELYGISAAWLLTGDGEMLANPTKVPPKVAQSGNTIIANNKVSGKKIIVGNSNNVLSNDNDISALKARIKQLEDENRWLRSIVEAGIKGGE